jgi:hypothetical protein
MFGPTISAAAAAWLILQGVTAAADVPPPSQPPAAAAEESKGSLTTITVEAQREREIVARQARSYVSSISVAPFHESLARWNAPICPLVAGLPREHGEFILTRISQIAAAAGAPLGGEHCRGNFYVVVSADPDALLKAWSRRDVSMFGDAGGTKVRGFLNASSPVRVWYNADFDTGDGTPLSADTPGLSQSGPSTSPVFAGIPNNTHARGFRLAHDEVRDLSSVVVLVDSRRARGISFGQLADYVAMAGLAELRLDANVGDAPTILHLFWGSGKTPPPGLSAFDQAFLKALYHTDQADRSQLSEIKISVVRDVARRDPHSP